MHYLLLLFTSALTGQIHGRVRDAVGDLVRSMNCYYSNLIEGHDTHPRDIERALTDGYSKEPRRRELQIEARAHIDLQRAIDAGEDPGIAPTAVHYLQWLHGEFYSRLPETLLNVENPDTGKRIRIVPGGFRTSGVIVGRHIPPGADELPSFLRRFEEAYAPERLSRAHRILSVAASHHRLLWIHPFFDGNGRVARLMSHAMLLRCGVGSSLWSAARGLARNAERYKAALARVDDHRQGELDGRGALSKSGRLNEAHQRCTHTNCQEPGLMTDGLSPTSTSDRLRLPPRIGSRDRLGDDVRDPAEVELTSVAQHRDHETVIHWR